MKKSFWSKLCLLMMTLFLSLTILQSYPPNAQKAFAASPDLKIHCKKPADWSKVNIYYYSDNATVPNWPGTEMTSEGNDWYTYTITGLSSANVIFNNGSGKQVPASGQAGFKVTAESWYKDGKMYTENPDQVTQAVPTSITINSSSSISVGQSASLTSSVTYSDGSVKQEEVSWSSSDSTLASLSSTSGTSVNLAAFKTGTVTITASKGTLTAEKTITINGVSASPIKVYFKSPWSTAKIYYWSTVPSAASVSWPGVDMTPEGDGWYSYTFNGATSTNLIFNNGSGAKTADLSRTSGTWYYSNNAWSDKDPRNVITDPVVPTSIAINSSSSINVGESTSLTSSVTYSDGSVKQEELNWSVSDSTLASLSSTSGTSVNLIALKTGNVTVTTSKGTLTAQKTITINDVSTNSIKVYFQSPWTTAKIYYWSTVPAVAPVSWPGVDMTSEGNGWYSYTLNGVSSTNLIFNNGSGSKTIDLSRTSGTWYYSNNAWSDKDPRIDTTAPTIIPSPAAGKVEATSLDVTLGVKDNVDVNPKIYYTIDGTDPVVGGNLYTGSIKLTKDTTIKAIAVDNSGNSSTIYSFNYILGQDVTPPVVTSNLAPGKYATAQDIKLSISDNKDSAPKLYFTTDGTAPYINDSYLYKGQTIHVDSFAHIYTIAVDAVGNKVENHFMYNIGGAVDEVDFRKETIYFVITPRFYDGDSSNNVHAWDDAQAKNPDTDPAWRGDFLGLTEKLDYIKALGFSAIWVTPPVKNASGYDYHGYHAIDFTEIDPRYKTKYDASAEEAYQKFIRAAHSKGLKVIQDVVFNHTSNFGEENLYPLFERVAPTSLNDSAASSLKNLLSPLLPANYDTLTPALQYAARINAMKESSNDINNIYHHEKSMGWEEYSVQTGQIAGDCVDLNTENPVVSKYLVDSYKKYINMGVDAFRVDTVKHVSRLTFNKEFIPQLKAVGGEDFYIFGEVCTRVREIWNHGTPAISAPFYTWKESKDYQWGDTKTNEASALQNYNDNMSTANQPSSTNAKLNGNTYHEPDHSKKSGLDVIDFPMHWNFANARDAFRVGVEGDYAYNDATWNVTYVDSHDYAPDGAPENQRFALGQDVWAENLSLMFTFRGIPTILYGSEIEFQKGKPIDVGPNSPLSETGRAYFGGNIEGTVQATDFGVYSNATGKVADTLNYPLAQHLIKLNRIRRAIPALQTGQYSVENIEGDGMAFKRRYTDVANNVDSFALVTISGNATFSNIPNGKYIDAVTGQTINVTNGTLTANCTGKGNLRVFVLDQANNPAPGKIGINTKYIY